MLWLYRNNYSNDWIYDDMTGGIIAPGEYYFKDDETGKRISCREYWNRKKEWINDEANNPKQALLDYAENQYDYKKTMREQEQEYLQETILNSPISYKELK